MNVAKVLLVACLLNGAVRGTMQGQEKENGTGAYTAPNATQIPTSGLISQLGPTFQIPASKLGKPLKVIVFGDQRFTDPSNTRVTNPLARRELVARIGEEHPDAVLMNGHVPYSGDVVDDYTVYRTETEVWRKEKLHVYPALGNHEFHGDPHVALEHWWATFPELANRRWYSVALGDEVYTIALDSDTSLLKESEQGRWLDEQLMNLPTSVKFVFLNLHHPPVADVQTRINVSHNPRPNEIALRDYLEQVAPKLHAKLIVSAGHIHNYERFTQSGVTFLVSGGGAASPVDVERAPDDLYQKKDFPNYHFVEFLVSGNKLQGKMYRLADPSVAAPVFEIKDSFEVVAEK